MIPPYVHHAADAPRAPPATSDSCPQENDREREKGRQTKQNIHATPLPPHPPLFK